MRTSKKGIDLIKHHEGLRTTAYQDFGRGIWTIGYGHTLNVHEGMKITKKRAGELLVEDLRHAEQAVISGVVVKINQAQFDALVSFVFNLGAWAFKQSTMLKVINRKEFDRVPFELSRWVHAGGKRSKILVNRRADEAAMFRSMTPIPDYTPIVKSDITPIPVREERENLSQSRTMKGGMASIAGTSVTAVSGAVSAVEPVTDKVSWLPDVLALLIVIGLIVAAVGAFICLWARRDDFNKARK